jgi:hypothetical protein
MAPWYTPPVHTLLGRAELELFLIFPQSPLIVKYESSLVFGQAFIAYFEIHVMMMCVLIFCTLCCSGQSSRLQMQRSGFDSWRYQIFREVMGLERGPLGLKSTAEEILE